MRIFFATVFFVLTVGGSAFAQTFSADLAKAKKIKLLEATHQDVTTVLGGDSPFNTQETFFSESTDIHVLYSSGKCTSEATHGVNENDWDVGEGKVGMIFISPKEPLTIDQLGIDYSHFRKEPFYRGRKDHQIYSDKRGGVAITISGDKVGWVVLFPTSARNSLLCNDDKIRKYYSKKEWKRDPQPKYACILINTPPKIVDLVLEKTEERSISVGVRATDPENDVLTYVYAVTGGKIVGVGPNVLWDLSDVKPGVYSLTAAADDGSGPGAGKYLTKTVVVN